MPFLPIPPQLQCWGCWVGNKRRRDKAGPCGHAATHIPACTTPLFLFFSALPHMGGDISCKAFQRGNGTNPVRVAFAGTAIVQWLRDKNMYGAEEATFANAFPRMPASFPARYRDCVLALRGGTLATWPTACGLCGQAVYAFGIPCAACGARFVHPRCAGLPFTRNEHIAAFRETGGTWHCAACRPAPQAAALRDLACAVAGCRARGGCDDSVTLADGDAARRLVVEPFVCAADALRVFEAVDAA